MTFTRQAKRRYRRTRKLTLTARVTFDAGGGVKVTKRVTIKLKR